MTDASLLLEVTLTHDKVSAALLDDAGNREVADGGAPDLSERPTIDVLRKWLGRWGLFSNLSARSADLATQLGWNADFAHLPVPETFTVLGEQLYHLAFPGDVGSLFDVAHDRASTAGTTLRVVLSIHDEEGERSWLADLPWEFLHHPRGFFLAAASSFVLSRFLDYREPRAQISRHPRPLMVLSVVATPQTGRGIGEAAWQLAATIQRDASKVQCVSVSWQDVQAGGLTQGKDVIHIIGVSRATPDGRMEIDLPGPVGQSEKALEQLVEPPVPRPASWHPPSLVVLHLLEANPFEYAATFGGHARALVRKRVPAVLAMQYPMPSGEVGGFARTLYEQLAEGVPIDVAVQAAREQFRREPGEADRLFGAPVLYLQATDGRLVDAAPAVEQGRAGGQLPGGPLHQEHAVRPPLMVEAAAPDHLAERLRAVARQWAPGDQELLSWVNAQPWASLEPAVARQRVRARMRNESGLRGPVLELMLHRIPEGGDPGAR